MKANSLVNSLSLFLLMAVLSLPASIFSRNAQANPETSFEVEDLGGKQMSNSTGASGMAAKAEQLKKAMEAAKETEKRVLERNKALEDIEKSNR